MSRLLPLPARCLGVALCFCLLACDASLGPDPGPTLVRFVNAAPDAVGALQFTLQGGPSAQLLRGESSAYIETDARTYPLVIEDEAGQWSITDDIRIEPGLHQTLIAFGAAADAGGILVGDEPGLPRSGQFFARILHLGPDIPGTLDVHVLAVGEQPDEGSRATADIGYPSNVEHFAVNAGSWRIVLTTAGTTDIVLDSGVHTYGSREAYTFVILNADDGGPELIRLRDGV